MSSLTSQQRKLLCLVLIVLLLVPIVWLGSPSSVKRVDNPGAEPGTVLSEAGGVLAQMRTKYELGESTLGEVDASSATMNLVLLGFRGLATTLLWQDLDKQKDTKNWAAMKTTTRSIIMLQPHYRKVWVFHGWNLAYNVSAEWDDVRDRYVWVKDGIKFYKQGAARNQKAPELFWYTGNTLGAKVGRSDEWRQFRRYFLRDPNPQYTINDVPGPDRELNPEGIDNYLVARGWFQNANDVWAEDEVARNPHLMGKPLFRSYPSRALFDYATVRQREGQFDEVTREAWAVAYDHWTKVYGQEFYDSPGGDVKLEWTKEDISKEFPKQADRDEKLFWTGRYQDMTNYRYWRIRGLAEREQNTLETHRELFDAQEALIAGDTTKAEELAMSGMKKFEKMITEFPDLLNDQQTIEEGMMGQLIWRSAFRLNHPAEESLPEEYPLLKFWEDNQGVLPDVQRQFDLRLSPIAS